MAVRFENTNDIQFGTARAGFTATHARGRIGSTDVLFTKQLTTPLVVASGAAIELFGGAVDLIFKKGEMEDAGIQSLLTARLRNPGVTIDLMTNSTTVVSVSGYSAQTVTAWRATTEDD